ncbi:MAG: 2-oxo acid dehydrogenase subunit E2, partial [Chitinophagaceae bacterium]
MATVDLVMPKMGESIMEATILKWHKNPGDAVQMDETVLEIATDKVDSEVPSTAAGVLEEILFNVNDVVPIGTVIARIKTGAAESQQTNNPPAPQALQPVESNATETVSSQPQYQSQQAATQATNQQPQSANTNRFYSPLVLNIAAQESISMSELENILGTGAEGRVSKKDILQYVSDKRAGKTKDTGTTIQQPAERKPDMVIPMNKVEQKAASEQNNQLGSYTGNVEIIEMDRMRKLIADHMVRSKHTSPHVTSFTEADVT